MIKPVACPRCGKEPAYGFFLDNDDNRIYEVFCITADCDPHNMAGKTFIGIVLRWNWRCFWEKRRMRRKVK